MHNLLSAACEHSTTGTSFDCVAAGLVQALEGIAQGPLEQVPIQDYFPKAAELSPVEFAEAATAS